MDWIHAKRRGPEWKQSSTDQRLSSISAPPLPLLVIFTIVIFLLSLSQYSSYKEQTSHAFVGFKIFLLLVPVLLVVLMQSSLLSGKAWRLDWRSSSQSTVGAAGFPWCMAVLVVVVLLLVAYQSSFQSKWFVSFWKF